jgi:hypothetical protein
MTESRTTRRMGHVACMGEIRNIFKILVKKLKWKRLSKIVGANARIVWSMRENRTYGLQTGGVYRCSQKLRNGGLIIMIA